MIVIEKEEVEQKLTMPICIGLMRTAMADLASGRAFQPLRTIHVLPGGNLYAFMPAYLGENDYFGAKVLTQFKGNLGTGWPSHMGYVQICESVHGSTVGMVDADSITAIRTGAVSGLATDLLARKDCKTLAVIGCGVQGRGHLEAMLAVRPGIQTVRCYDLSAENARRYAQEMSEKFKVPVTACKSVQEAVEDADIMKELRANFTGECTEVGMYLAMSRQAEREGYPEIADAFKRYAFEEAEHAAKFAELLGEVLVPCTKTNVKMRAEAEAGACAGKMETARKAKAKGYDAIHDTVHEMAKDEARHGRGMQGLLDRYFK